MRPLELRFYYHAWDRSAADRGTIFRSPNGHRNFKTADPGGVEVSFFEYLLRPSHVDGGRPPERSVMS